MVKARSSTLSFLWLVLFFVVGMLFVTLIAKRMETADRVADAFIRENAAQYDSWVINTSFTRKYTIFGVFTESPCSILNDDVVELKVNVHDISGTVTAVMHVCFRGDRGSKYPLVYITDSKSKYGFIPQKGFP